MISQKPKRSFSECRNKMKNDQNNSLKGINKVKTQGMGIIIKDIEEAIIIDNIINFEIKSGPSKIESWITRGNLVCPCCGNTTENSILKQQFYDGKIEDRLLIVIYESKEGKSYRLPNAEDLFRLNNLPEIKNKYSENFFLIKC